MKTKTEPKITEREPKMTQSRLAALLGVSRQSLSAHIKTGNAPNSLKEEDWTVYLAGISRMRDSNLPPDMRRDIATERLRYIRATAVRVEMDNRVKATEMIPFNKVEIFFQQFCAVGFWAELDRLKNEFPPNLKGKSEIEIYEECDKQIEQIKTNLETRLSIWMKENGKEEIETPKQAA